MNTNRDFENLIGMIQDTKKELNVGRGGVEDQTSSEDDNGDVEIAGESQYIQVPKESKEVRQPVSNSQVLQNFDYLDYRENEERLERLKN